MQQKPVFGTFGIYRWFLACVVFFSHLGPKLLLFMGAPAVYCFFMLSGYVVSYIWDTRYRHLKGGLDKYFINRALRIYPAYWFVAIISIPLVFRFPMQSYFVNSWMTAPEDIFDWLKNITVFGMVGQNGTIVGHAFIPISWSLALEMQWWVCIPLVLRNPNYLKKFFILMAIIFAIILNYDIDVRNSFRIYFIPLAACRHFGLGMLLYLRKKAGWRDLSHGVGAVAILILIPYIVFNAYLYRNMHVADFYGLYFINAVVIYYLSGIDNRQLVAWLRNFDDFVGNLAYPIFLLNTFCSTVLVIMLPQIPYRSGEFFLIACIFVHILAFIIHRYVESPVMSTRLRVKEEVAAVL